jgi:predicted dehydrogenase
MSLGAIPRVGLIGLGRWGRNIARVLDGQGALAAIGVRTPRETGFDAPTVSVETLLASDVEAVAIAVPPSEHRALVTAALQAGKHVFVEKPLALTGADARACAEAAEAAGKVLMVGHIMRHNPAFARLLEMVRAGAVGTVRHVSSVRFNAASVKPGDSALWLLAPHDASMVLALLGRPDEVKGEQVGGEHRLVLRYANGAGAEIAVSRTAGRKHAELVVMGDAGALIYEDTAPPERRLVFYADPEQRAGGEAIALPSVEPLAAELACFLGAVRGLNPPLADPEEGVAVVELLERAERGA